MNMRRAAVYVYGFVSAIVVAFQIALALGAPWGAYAMGGAFPGQFPPEMRVAAVVQAILIGGMVFVVAARAGLILPNWYRVSRWLIWLVVAFATLSLFLNLITPSAIERAIWAPTAFLLLLSSTTVAFSKSTISPAR